jgi:hypothetical protein
VDGIKVTGTTKLDRLGMGNVPEIVYRVSYQTALGAVGVVEVDARDFTAEKLPEVLAEERDRANLAFTIANGG